MLFVTPSTTTVADPGPSSQDGERPLRVGVLVDLTRGPGAGGHVRTWERLAQAAAGMAERLDLAVHFAADAEGIETVAPNVRFVAHRPVFSSRSLPFLDYVPDHADLAPHHPRLARWLGVYDVVHTTDGFFAFARTAARFCRHAGIPLVNSVHTDTPSYCRVFTARAVERLAGELLRRPLIDGLGVHRWAEAWAWRSLRRHQRQCRYVLVAEKTSDGSPLPPERVRILRRGIDLDQFSPARRDPAALRRRFAIPEDRLIVLYVGRVDRGKNVPLLARAVRVLLDAGLPLHLVCVGRGEDRGVLESLLGGHVSCPGGVAPDALAVIYASADVFAFPSAIEISPNVVREAMASGLPVIVSRPGAIAERVGVGAGGISADATVKSWCAAIRDLATDPARRRAMAAAARARAERTFPSWREVLAEDLLPIWTRAATESRRR